MAKVDPVKQIVGFNVYLSDQELQDICYCIGETIELIKDESIQLSENMSQAKDDGDFEEWAEQRDYNKQRVEQLENLLFALNSSWR